MLQMFHFNELAVVVRHWYEIGEDDEEHGARLELLKRADYPRRGTASASQPIGADGMLWRVDLFDRLGDPPGSMKRAHHHLRITDSEPLDRDYDDNIAADPFGWTERRLSDLPALLTEVGAELEDPEGEAADVRRSLPSIMSVMRSMAPAACDSPAKCMEATRDTTDTVRMMATEFRDDPRDPRLTESAVAWPHAG